MSLGGGGVILFCAINEVEEDLEVRGCKTKRVMLKGTGGWASVSADPLGPCNHRVYNQPVIQLFYLVFA